MTCSRKEDTSLQIIQSKTSERNKLTHPQRSLMARADCQRGLEAESEDGADSGVFWLVTSSENTAGQEIFVKIAVEIQMSMMGEQDSIADDTPIKIDISNEAKTKVEITMIGLDYSFDASTDENKKMNVGVVLDRLQDLILIEYKNQKDCRRTKLEMDRFEIEFDESCLVRPTTQEEINLIKRLPKKTIFRVYYVPRTLPTVNLLGDRTCLLFENDPEGLKDEGFGRMGDRLFQRRP
ncbi:hypothetical protein BY996DRAFT_6583709 [Phakopsora pachyrhizi]|nr:hypothetical protein BY996DRAFT_6583709 [Phakopsora pachyrhizi]